MADSYFITLEELLKDPEPIPILTGKRVKDKKSGKLVDASLRVYPRRPTDIEKELCAGAANGARRALRRELNDVKNEKHALLLREPLEDLDDASLRQLWVNGNLMERAAQIQLNSLEEREVVPEPEGDIVPAAVRDEHDEAVESAEGDRIKYLIEALESSRRELDVESEAIPHEDLLAAAMPAHIETIVGRTWNDVYTGNLIARCTFNDAKHTKATFAAVSDVEKLRSQRPAAYSTLADTHKALLLDMEPTLGF